MGRIQPFSLGLGMDLQHSGNAAGGMGFSIIRDLRPDFATDSRSVLDSLGQPPEYLETVATWRNLVDGPVGDGIQATANEQPLMLAHANGENYLHCPGVTNNGASVDLTGTGTLSTWIMEISVDCREMSDSGSSLILPNNASIEWVLGSTGYMHFNGGGGGGLFIGSIDPFGENVWRIIGHGDFLEAQQLVGGVWTTIGTNLGVTNTDLPFNGTAYIGADLPHSRWPIRGKIHYAKIWNGDDDSVDPIFHVDFSTFNHDVASGVAETGQTVTIHQSGGNKATLVGRPMVRMDGVDDGFDLEDFQIAGPMTFASVVKVTNQQGLFWNHTDDSCFVSIYEDDDFPTDSAPSGGGNYFIDGDLTPIGNRIDLRDAIVGDRHLIVRTHTYDPNTTATTHFGGTVNFGGFIIQGDVEALYVFKRILSDEEIDLLENSLMDRYGIS